MNDNCPTCGWPNTAFGCGDSCCCPPTMRKPLRHRALAFADALADLAKARRELEREQP